MGYGYEKTAGISADGRAAKNLEVMVSLGITEEKICLLVRDRRDKPICRNSLRKHFKKELETGATKLNAKVGHFMVAISAFLLFPRKGRLRDQPPGTTCQLVAQLSPPLSSQIVARSWLT